MVKYTLHEAKHVFGVSYSYDQSYDAVREQIGQREHKNPIAAAFYAKSRYEPIYHACENVRKKMKWWWSGEQVRKSVKSEFYDVVEVMEPINYLPLHEDTEFEVNLPAKLFIGDSIYVAVDQWNGLSVGVHEFKITSIRLDVNDVCAIYCGTHRFDENLKSNQAYHSAFLSKSDAIDHLRNQLDLQKSALDNILNLLVT